jgi:hypothetical protein
MPIVEYKLSGNIPIDREGAIVEMIIHVTKRVTSKITFKVAKIAEAKSIELEYAGGDLVGTGTWTFEPTDGKTKVQYRLNARTNRLLVTLLSHFLNIKKGHSDTMQKGFKACNSYLCKK